MQHANVSRAAAKPSLLAKTLDRNPAMLDAAIRLHQEGAIPPSTHLIDLDAVANNASVIAEAARRFNLMAFAMTKQDGHEPHMTRLVLDRGFDGVTAVEAMQAFRIHRYDFPLANVGHTSHCPVQRSNVSLRWTHNLSRCTPWKPLVGCRRHASRSAGRSRST